MLPPPICQVDAPLAPPLVLPTDGLWSEPAEVTAVAWGQDDSVVLCTDTGEVCLWRVEREEKVGIPTIPGRHRIILSPYVNHAEQYEGEGESLGGQS